MTWEELGLQHRYRFRKEMSAVKDDSKKSWSGIETKAGVENEEVGMEIGLVGIHQEGGLTFAWIERKTSAPIKTELIVWPPLQ